MSEPLFAASRIQAAGGTLTDRQTYAFRVIRDQQPIRSDALGAHLHAYRKANGGEGHLPDESCDWCVSDGKSVGDALARKGLVRYLRGKGWVTSAYTTSDDVKKQEPSSQLGVGDPWPDGF